jgi:DNA repair protein RecO (recombination protein O)
MKERTYVTEAIVLRRSDFLEADRLLTLLTPERGRLQVVARSVRRPTSRMAPHLEVFTLSRVFVVRRRNLDLVVQAETIRPFPTLRTDLQRVSYAYQAAEVADLFVEAEVTARSVFSLFVQMLEVCDAGTALPLALLAYKLQLLGHLGYQPQLQQCARCSSALSLEGNRFRPDLGGAVCGACGASSGLPLSVGGIKALRWLLQQSLASVGRLQVTPTLLAEMAQAVDALIEHQAERRLRTTQFLHQVERLTR